MTDRFRRLPTVLVFLLLVPAALPGGAFGASGGGTDPDDVALRLDLRAVSHADDSTTVTYTAETYGTFADADVDLRWSLDLNGDGRSDLAVATQWEDDNRSLVASVEDARERVVARAMVTRPAPDGVRVSFPRSVLGAVTSYRYTVIGVTDLDGDGETDNGERDVAPNTGFYEHRLGSDGPSGGDGSGSPAPPTTIAPATTPAPGPGPAANGQSHGGAVGPPSAPPSGTTPAATGAAPASGSTGPSTVAAVGSGVRPALPPGASRPSGATVAAGSAVSPDPASSDGSAAGVASPRSSVPRTGPVHEGLATAGVALLLAGTVCRLVARKPGGPKCERLSSVPS